MKATMRGFFALQVLVASLGSSISLLAADWPMFAHDPQRTGWATEEKTLTRENVRELELKWKVKVNNEPKFLTALTAPVVAADVDTAFGKLSLVYVAGSSNNIFALNAANGAIPAMAVRPRTTGRSRTTKSARSSRSRKDRSRITISVRSLRLVPNS